jgi:UDP-GlcNAc:undecaprenyl-phosphate GlcNAc-1-phosphate transferase
VTVLAWPLAAACVASLSASGGITWLARRMAFIAPFNPIVPQHREPAALGGGGALLIGVAAGLWVASRTTGSALALSGFGAALLPALILGLADDIRPFRPPAKLLLQSAAAAFGMWTMFAGSLSVHDPLFILAGALLGVILMNAINFLDVSDGYAASVSAVSFAGLAWFGDAVAPIAVCGACLGFLAWNWPPARIYMGDAGGHMLGMAAALSIAEAFLEDRSVALAGIACVGVPLGELVMLVAVRFRRGLPVWQRSPDHSALRLQVGGFSKAKAALAASTLQLALILATAAFTVAV